MTLPNVYPVTVDGIGEFVFKRRTMRLQLAIEVETARLSEGVALPNDVAIFIAAVAELKVLTEAAPKGWAPDEADPYEPEAYSKIIRAWRALSEKEGSFRRGAEKDAAAASPPTQP